MIFLKNLIKSLKTTNLIFEPIKKKLKYFKNVRGKLF